MKKLTLQNVLADTMGLIFTPGNIAVAAKITLVNVLLINGLFTLIDYIRRKITVDRPVKIITDATEKIMKGDFFVRISPMQGKINVESTIGKGTTFTVKIEKV